MKGLAKVFLGLFFTILGFMACLFSTYATIIPITMNFKGSKQLILVGIFIIIQITVFILAMTKNYIGKNTPQHYILVSRIVDFLMVVSIISTITFFSMDSKVTIEHSKSIAEIYRIVPFLNNFPCYKWILDMTTNIIFIWAICIILDMLSVKMPLIGFDLVFGFQHKTEHVTMFKMIFSIITYKPKMIIQHKYNMLTNSEHIENTEQIQNKDSELLINAAENVVIEDSELLKITEHIENSEQIQNNSEPTNAEITEQLEDAENTEHITESNNAENTEHIEIQNISELQNNVVNFSTKNNSALNEITEQITEYLIQNYSAHDVVKSFEKMFNLKKTDYRKIQNMLKENNIIYTNKCYMYMEELKNDKAML